MVKECPKCKFVKFELSELMQPDVVKGLMTPQEKKIYDGYVESELKRYRKWMREHKAVHEMR